MEYLVQGTNDSSIISKHSMVQRGYFEDKIINHFVTKGARRSPLINMGYFARALVMDYAIKYFLQTMKNFQILSLGAGFDTTYFRLVPLFPDISYFEVDLPDVVDNKIRTIKHSPELSSVLLDVSEGESEFRYLSSKHYNIFTHDLSGTDGLDHKLSQLGFDFNKPTIVFSECAITYIEEENSTALIKWVNRRIKAAVFLNYEQFNPDDGFGKIMITHFNKIQSPLKSLTKYRTLEEQKKRYCDAGWEYCRVHSVMDLLQHITNFKDMARIEPFDEWEEFHLKCCHYSLSIATQNVDVSISLPSHTYKSTMRRSTELQPITTCTVERYAHSCVEVSNSGVLIIGGFGSSNTHRHGRSNEILYVGPTNKMVRVSTDASSVTWDCLYTTCTVFGPNHFIIFGGRTSPTKEVNVDPVLVHILNGESLVELSPSKIVLSDGNHPCGRWRHTAVHYNQSVLVYGGRNEELEVLGDLWELRLVETDRKWQWTQKKFHQSSTPCARFAHAMVAGNNKIYVSGGLDAQLCPLSDVWELEIRKEEVEWKMIQTQTAIPPMYSHSLHYHKNKLIFVGGVNTSPTHQPSFSILDLSTFQTSHYCFEASDLPVMLHNHASILNKDDFSITCYGGGGNCFSFGTHFNKHPLKILVPEV